MKPHVSALLLFSAVLPLAGCGGDVRTGSSATFVTNLDHAFFPLTRGLVRIYQGEEDGAVRREEVEILWETRVIVGTHCTAVMQEVFDDNELVEITTEWYAQDVQGNVWKFGEESLELEDGQIVRSEDSWIAGVDDIEPWMAFSADPKVGDQYSGYSPEGEDAFTVLSVTATAVVPAGTFENCLEILEISDDLEDQDIILYAPGVGRVSEKSTGGQVVLWKIVRK